MVNSSYYRDEKANKDFEELLQEVEMQLRFKPMLLNTRLATLSLMSKGLESLVGKINLTWPIRAGRRFRQKEGEI